QYTCRLYFSAIVSHYAIYKPKGLFLLFANLLLIQWMMKNIHANVMQDCNNHKKKNHGNTVCKNRDSR
ncbi:hypothetical protein, partial [Rickettsia conorii]|uniref:hypothetical protein n=1 Tax=Rickettsia conorii TaxID=781 RepID=UPI002B4077F1